MPLDPITEYAPGELITAAWANTLRRNQDLLSSRTGGDPGMPGLLLAAATGTTGIWRFLQSSDFTAGLIPDSALVHQQVYRVNSRADGAAGAQLTFAAAVGIGSGFYDVGVSTDSPVPARPGWIALQTRHWNWGAGDYRFIITCDLYDQNEMYVRSVVGGAAGLWRKLWHSGNLDPLLRAGGTMNGDITFANNLTGLVLAGASRVRDDIPGNLLQILCNGDHVILMNEAGTVIMMDMRPNIVAFAGQIQGPSLQVSGAILSSGGNVQGLQLIAAAAAGTPPLVVPNSVAKVNNLHADILDGCHAGNANGNIPINNGIVCNNLNAAMLQGLVPSNAAGQIPISNGVGVANLNSDMLNDRRAGNANGNVAVNNGTVCANLNADLVDDRHAGNAAGNVAVNNGTENANLNAALLNGMTASQIISQAASGGVPVGIVALWKGATAPAGWVIDTEFRGRFVIGADPSWPTIGSIGGVTNHTHAVDLRHGHNATGLGIGGNIVAGTPIRNFNLQTPGSDGVAQGDHIHGHTLDVTGATDQAGSAAQGSTATDHYPPWRAAHYIRKT